MHATLAAAHPRIYVHDHPHGDVAPATDAALTLLVVLAAFATAAIGSWIGRRRPEHRHGQ